MASISVSEDDFSTLANAANAAMRRGDVTAANALDKLARKTNAALANRLGPPLLFAGKKLRWDEVPTCLEKIHG